MKIKEELSQILSSINQHYPASRFKDPEIYAQWLAQTYFFVKHSTALLGYALPHLKNDELKHRFEKHMGEEERHDLMLLKDLEKMGRNISQFQELSLTQAFYHSQYYRIQFEGGTSLLGYILFLEGLASGWGQDLYRELKPLYPQSVLFARVHAEEDPAHVGEAVDAIGKLSKPEQESILKNLHFSHQMYEEMISTMLHSQNRKKIA